MKERVLKAMINFSFEKNKNIYDIRYKEWELCIDIEKEIIVNRKTGEIIDYETMRTTVFEDLSKACDEKGRINFLSNLSNLYKKADKTGKSKIYTTMEVSILEIIGCNKRKEFFFSKMRKKDKLYSLAISNPNLSISIHYNGDVPERFVDFCLKNGVTLGNDSYKAFQLSKKINNYPEDVRLLVAQFDKMIDDSKLPKEYVVKILRCYKNSLLKYGEYTLDGRYRLSDIFFGVADYPELIKLIDTQSSFALAGKAVVKNYKLLKYQEEQERIEKSQKRIKELETLIYRDYCFIVPTTLKEFVDEGKQQHNCVGHFYNNSMSKGEIFIYFIRKKNKSGESYITCRFNVERNETEEARYKFNDSDIREEDKKAILKSEDFIRKIVKEKEIKTNKPVF